MWRAQTWRMPGKKGLPKLEDGLVVSTAPLIARLIIRRIERRSTRGRFLFPASPAIGPAFRLSV